jgi:enamine deaminase RidA (YjgF/YER057c/UK114 family)
MNRVWEAWVATGAAPTRATVASPQLASPDYKIEIAVTAPGS